MVAHTGFLISARRLAPDTVLPELKRKVKPTYSDEDVEAWTPGAIGVRDASDKRVRKAARQAETAARHAHAATEQPTTAVHAGESEHPDELA
ncbi:MAG: tRNA (adenine-N1)-methyltransferase, partial [Terrimesophilobacter sp.]